MKGSDGRGEGAAGRGAGAASDLRKIEKFDFGAVILKISIPTGKRPPARQIAANAVFLCDVAGFWACVTRFAAQNELWPRIFGGAAAGPGVIWAQNHENPRNPHRATAASASNRCQ